MSVNEIYKPRPHVYRAKRLGCAPTVNPEYAWAEGAYYVHHNRMVSPLGDELRPEDVDHVIIQSGFADWNMPRQLCAVPVDPDTVCEATEWKDKNGKRIWEYCFIQFPDTGEEGYEYKEGFDFENIAMVVKKNGRWELDHFASTNSAVLDDMNDGNHDEFISVFADCEVIGNLFDNPEILEQIGKGSGKDA